MQKIFHPDPAIGFLALARKSGDAATQGTLIAPAKSIAELQRVAFNTSTTRSTPWSAASSCCG